MKRIKQILIIDDEADIREIVKVSLQMTEQWQVLTAASGEAGVAIAVDTQPDVILLDVVIPETGGLVILKILKDNPITQSIPVIMLTAIQSRDAYQQYVELGAKAVLTKPFDPGLLGDQIAAALDWE